VIGASLHNLVVEWGSFYANHAFIRTIVEFVHLGALVVAGGAALGADRGILAEARRGRRARRRQLVTLQRAHRVVIAGLLLMALSGSLLFASDVDTFLYSRMFWIKMSLIGLLLINGLILIAAEKRVMGGAPEAWRTLRFSACASVTLWLFTTLTGVALTNS
jgi:uncharacterized membrane protein